MAPNFQKIEIIAFFFKTERQFEFEGGFFAHVTNSEIVAVQMRNISKNSYTLSKNLKIEHIRNYDEKNYFMTTPKSFYLTVTSESIVNIRKILNHKKKTVLTNDITVYENESTTKKIEVITKKTFEI